MTDTDHTGHRHDYSVPSHAEAAHEQVEFDREIQYHQLIWMGVGLLVMAAIAGVAAFFLLRGFVQWRDTSTGPPPVVTAPPIEVPGPRLLARPERELLDLRSTEHEQLGSYGWVDPKLGLVHIPIERALELAAQKGLPNVSSGAAPATPGANAPAAASRPAAAPAQPLAAAPPGGAR